MVSTIDDEALAAMLYDLERDIRQHENAIEKLKQDREALTNDLAERLGPGGATFIHNGKTVAYIGPGTRTLNKAALERAIAAHEGDLPTSLLPREEVVVKYPSVSALDKASAVLAARGIKVEDLTEWRSGIAHKVQFREVEE